MPVSFQPEGRACTVLALSAMIALMACHPQGARFPWSTEAPRRASEHAEVHTLNADYRRRESHVLVREIEHPTRAALDYAAYHANFMIADPEPDPLPAAVAPPSAEQPFAGSIDRASLTPDAARTALTPSELARPFAFAPLVEYLLAHQVAGAGVLEDLGSAVRSESWGEPPTPGVASQTVGEAFVHRSAGGAAELWVKIEFAPWFKLLGTLPDQDRDGWPELYGRARGDKETQQVVAAIEGDYATRVLTAAEVKAWANQLSSYWYPSFNTDLVPSSAQWPDSGTEPEIARELRGQSFSAPTIVLRGKPQGVPTYQVFVVRALDSSTQAAKSDATVAADQTALVLGKTQPTPDAQRLAAVIRAELAAHGSAAAWDAQLEPFHAALRKRLASAPKRIKAFAGENGFLFYRDSLEYAAGGDLEQQPAGKNPLPIILEFKQQLDALGVDFLFVPVPAKVEIFPDQLDAKLAGLAGQVVVPWSRKFLLSLAEHGVESVDLLSPFLRARVAAGLPGQEPLYQHQDTHWTHRGLELAAEILGARIKRYPWYRELAQHAEAFSQEDASFTRLGDLCSRLPAAQQKKYRPETLIAHRVLRSDGTPYDDDPDSPIVILGDSFTGVYELTDAEHAGLSAHLARQVSYPVDLVMSYGGGPNVRNKLMRRGVEALGKKKLVIWVMAARDLYDYWEDWEPLKTP